MRKHQWARRVAVCAFAAALSSCGGESDSPVATPTPSPVPAPSPSPSPSPSPTAPSLRFSTSGLIGYVTIDVNENGRFGGVLAADDSADVRTATDRSGWFGPGVPARLDDSPGPDAPLWAMSATGYDSVTGFHYVDVRTPRGGTVLSPVTTLLRTIDDDVVPANLGLGIDAARLATFDAVQETANPDADTAALGRRVALLNLKLLALAGFPNSSGFGADRSIVVAGNLEPLSEQLRVGRVDLNDAASIRLVLDRSPVARRASAEARDAAAQLLARWGQAIDRFDARERAPRQPFGSTSAPVQRALRVHVLPELMALFGTVPMNSSSPPAPARLAALTVDRLLADITSFDGFPFARTDPGSVTAVADYRSFDRYVAGNTIVLDNQCLVPGRQAAHCNDFDLAQLTSPNPGNPRWWDARVPAAFSQRIRVTADPGYNMVIERLDQTAGIVWFEYDVRIGQGPISTSRVYLRLNDEI